MRIINVHIMLSVLLALFSPQILADDVNHDHGPTIFHALWLDVQHGGGRAGSGSEAKWHGWLGGDVHKLWLQGKLEQQQNQLEKSEFWALYSRQVHEFWDLQLGLRHDTQPDSTTYLVTGLNGLAPYWFETQAHLFVSDHGDLTARLEQKTHLLFTQKLGLAPYYELDFSAQTVERQALGRGVTKAKTGIKLFYEVHRKFAPYIDFRYEKHFGKTASFAREHGHKTEDWRVSLGVTLLF